MQRFKAVSSVEKEEGKKKKFVCQESSFRRKRKRDTERRGHMVVLADPNPRQAKSADSVRVDKRMDLPQLSWNQPETSQKAEELSHSNRRSIGDELLLNLVLWRKLGATNEIGRGMSSSFQL